MISQKSLEKFKRLTDEVFHEKLDDDEALRRATRLLNVYRALYAPLLYPSGNNNKNTQNDNELNNQKHAK